jgi:hypothetical protein
MSRSWTYSFLLDVSRDPPVMSWVSLDAQL